MEEVYQATIEYLKRLPKKKQEKYIEYFRSIGSYDGHPKCALDINEAHVPKVDETKMAKFVFYELLKKMPCEKIALELENIINS